MKKSKYNLEVLRKVTKEICTVLISMDKERIEIILRTSTGGLTTIRTKEGYLYRKGNLAIGLAELEVWNPVT